MKNRKTWYWIIGLAVVGLLVCGGFVGLGLWAAGRLGSDDGLAFGPGIAIVRVEGVILPGEAPPPNPFAGAAGVAYSQQIIDDLEQANENEDVVAIVLFVDSPGGSAFASDEVALKLNEVDKPIIAAMGSVAASGGYYVSAPTDEIWAAPQTLTCSIGVISQFPNFEGFAEEYGITFITIKSGKYKDIGNPFREFTGEERELMEAITEDIFSDFVAVVAKGRSMTDQEVREIADGRICTGKQALEMGLVDQLGHLPDAIERAAELGGIEGEPRIIEYRREPSFFEAFGASLYRPSPLEELQQLLHYHNGSPFMYLYTGP